MTLQLETDANLLLVKSQMALKRYAHHLVIGNLLQTRKYEVVFVDKSSIKWIQVPQVQMNGDIATSNESDNAKTTNIEMEIESLIVPEVVKRHGGMIWQAVAAGGR